MYPRLKTADKDNLVRHFQTVTNMTDSKEAREILRKNNWKINEAVDSYFTNYSQRRMMSNRVDRKTIENLFKSYASPQKPDCMLVNEIIRFCEDLRVDPTSIQVLALAWKLKAKEQCVFTKTEFVEGLYEMGCDSMDKLRAHIPNIMEEIADTRGESFKRLYRFTFEYGKEGERKNLEIETACAYWAILLDKRFPLLPLWTEFLTGAGDGKKRNTIPQDTWNVTLDFVNQVSDISQYDTEGAWPTLLDEFVEFAREKMSSSAAATGSDEQMQCD